MRSIHQVIPKLYRNSMIYRGKLPHSLGSVNGNYETFRAGGWTDGFWPAMLLLGYSYNKDQVLLNEFQSYMPMLLERINDDPVINKQREYLALDHDVGFIFFLTNVYKQLLDPDEICLAVGIKAAQSLRERFKEKGGYINAFNDWEWDTPEQREAKKGKMIVDSLMNVPLLFWAYQVTGDAMYQHIALEHVKTVQSCMVRDNGSTYHQFDFDPHTGKRKGGVTGQGYHDESCWSRGQAWAIYGFALAARYSQNEEFRHTAIRCLEYWNASLLPLGDAPWDFDAPRKEGLPIDSSAMAITAAGMLELWSQTGVGLYKSMAIATLDRLGDAHLAPDFPKSEALLLHGSAGPAYQRGSEKERSGNYFHANQSVIYGDYFYLEALLRLEDCYAKTPWDF